MRKSIRKKKRKIVAALLLILLGVAIGFLLGYFARGAKPPVMIENVVTIERFKPTTIESGEILSSVSYRKYGENYEYLILRGFNANTTEYGGRFLDLDFNKREVDSVTYTAVEPKFPIVTERELHTNVNDNDMWDAWVHLPGRRRSYFYVITVDFAGDVPTENYHFGVGPVENEA